MKSLNLVLALGSLLSVNALRAEQVDVIADAINDGDLETLRIMVTVGTTHNHSFAVTQAQKETYETLAQAKIEKCKEECVEATSLSSLGSLDWLSLTAFASLTASGIFAVHDSLSGDEATKKEKYWKKPAGFGLLLYGFGGCLRALKDVIKHATEVRTKAKANLKKAEKVAKLVHAIPVTK